MSPLGNIRVHLEFFYDIPNLVTPLDLIDMQAHVEYDKILTAMDPENPDRRSLSKKASSSSMNSSISVNSGQEGGYASSSQYSARTISTSSSRSFLPFNEKTQNSAKELYDIYNALSCTGWNGMKLVNFIGAVQFLQDFYVHHHIPKTFKTVEDRGVLQVAAYFLTFLVPTYGAVVANYCGHGSGLTDFFKTNADYKMVLKSLKIDKQDMLMWEFAYPSMYTTSFFACHDRRSESIIVAMRGTWNLHDCLMDVEGEYAPYGRGLAHKGAAQSVEWLKDKYLEKWLQLVRDRKVNAIYFVGHSISGAILSLFLIMYRDIFMREFGPNFKCEAYNYGGNPVTCANLAHGCEDFVSAFVNHDDLVPHLSYGGVMDLKELLVMSGRLRSDRSLSKAEKFAKMFDFKVNLTKSGKHPRLHIAGRIYLIYKTPNVGLNSGNPIVDNGIPHYIVEETDSEKFHDIQVVPKMVLKHLINAYDRTIRKVHQINTGPRLARSQFTRQFQTVSLDG